MSLLWLTPEIPREGGAGGAVRSFHQVRALARRGWDVTIVAPAYEDGARGAAALMDDGVTVRAIRRPQSQPLEALIAVGRRPALIGAGARDPWLGWQAQVFWTELRRTVNDVLASDRPAAAIVEHDFAAVWARHLPADLPTALVFHNATWELQRRAGQRLEAARFRSFIARHATRLSYGWAVSDADAAAIEALLPALAVDVVPNGVDVARLAGVPIAGGNPGRLLFTGTLSYAPNADGILWFARDVLPRVRAQKPDVTLEIVGRNAPRAVRALDGRDGIRVAGFVPALEPHLAAAQVSVAPLRSGGGTKLKVLEALAGGRPLVCTSVAAEGLELHDGEHLLIADDAAGFADAVVALLDDQERRATLAAAGRKQVADRYDWDALGAAFHESLTRWRSPTSA